MPSPDAELGALYQERILDHYRSPRNRGELAGADASATVKNPLCGDEVSVALAFDGDCVRDARFTGEGCSISRASASMMTEALRGISRSEAETLHARFLALMDGGPVTAALGDLTALSGVARLPARIRCALLPWEAMRRALAAPPRP